MVNDVRCCVEDRRSLDIDEAESCANAFEEARNS
jgi:hypothetical protein